MSTPHCRLLEAPQNILLSKRSFWPARVYSCFPTTMQIPSLFVTFLLYLMSKITILFIKGQDRKGTNALKILFPLNPFYWQKTEASNYEYQKKLKCLKTIYKVTQKNSSYLLALSLLAMAFMPMLSNLDPIFSSKRWPNLKKRKGGVGEYIIRKLKTVLNS